MARQRLRRRTRNLTLALVWVSVTVTVACGGGAPPDAPAAAVPRTPSEAPQQTAAQCTNLLTRSFPDTIITSAAIVPASGAVPEYCKVIGGIEDVILFEIALPTTTWNGKFFYAGGGGYNGTIPVLTHALARGYAAAGTDTGHRGDHWDASAMLNSPQVQVNYAHRGAHLVTVLGKEVVQAYYGGPTRRSYFMGCSNGGKMGLMAVQRYPEDFDGVVVGGSVIDRTGLMVMFNWTQRALLGAEIPPYKIPAMQQATLAACDAGDGLGDGLIDRPDTCSFDPGVLTCKGADGPACLTPAQVEAWRKILDGPRNAAGQQLYPGYSPGHEGDYEAYVTGFGIMHGYPSSNFMYMDNFMRWFVFGPSFDTVRSFDYEKGPAALEPFKKDQDAADPDLSPFRDHGGKIIMWNGWADHSTPPLRALQYYEEVRQTVGGNVDDFARLFMVPGAYHCSGGPGPNSFGTRGIPPDMHDPEKDILAALDRWVEQGIAPAKLIATKYANDDPAAAVVRTRPLCPYPQTAQYTGSGSIDDAVNFVCASAPTTTTTR